MIFVLSGLDKGHELLSKIVPQLSTFVTNFRSGEDDAHILCATVDALGLCVFAGKNFVSLDVVLNSIRVLERRFVDPFVSQEGTLREDRGFPSPVECLVAGMCGLLGL